MGKPTPGPWAIYRTGDFTMIFASDAIPDIDPEANRWPLHIADDVPNDADAHVIKAAPDLLELIRLNHGEDAETLQWAQDNIKGESDD